MAAMWRPMRRLHLPPTPGSDHTTEYAPDASGARARPHPPVRPVRMDLLVRDVTARRRRSRAPAGAFLANRMSIGIAMPDPQATPRRHVRRRQRSPSCRSGSMTNRPRLTGLPSSSTRSDRSPNHWITRWPPNHTARCESPQRHRHRARAAATQRSTARTSCAAPNRCARSPTPSADASKAGSAQAALGCADGATGECLISVRPPAQIGETACSGAATERSDLLHLQDILPV
jgi:hypothetical protein